MTLFIFMLIFIAIAVGLAWFLIANDTGEKEPIGALWLAAGFGLLGAVIAASVEHVLIQPNAMLPTSPTGTIFGASMAVGCIEEFCKFLPLSLFLYRKRYFNEHTDGVIYFALAGLAFGLPENILYTVQFGAHTGLTRILLTPFFHAATTAMVGYFLARRKMAHKSPYAALLPLLTAMILHGLYDFGLASGKLAPAVLSILITLSLSGGLFYFFIRAKQLDQALGLSVVGHNTFCRSCGWPNPSHNLYCVHCGNNA